MPDQDAYTKGSIGRVMIRTAFAMLSGTVAMSGYNLADTYFIGQLDGSEPLAAMGFTLPVILFIGCIFHGLAIGIMTPTAQSLGGRKKAKAAKFVTTGIFLISIFSIILGILGYFFGRPLYELFRAEGLALDLTCEYMNIWFLGCLTAALTVTGNNLLISAGDSRTASLIMVIGMLLNVGLDPLLISGWGPVKAFGMAGAAWATVISQLITGLTLLVLIHKRHHLLHLNLPDRRRLKEIISMIVGVAIPATIGMLMMPLGSAIITRLTARFGNEAVAGAAAAGRLEAVAFAFPMALGITLIPVIAQNFGARLYGRLVDARRFAMKFAFYYLLVMALLFTLLADPIARCFSEDPGVQHIMVLYMRIVSWSFWASEVHRYSGFFFTGVGRPAVSAGLNAIRILGLMIPLSLLACWFDSMPGLFWARSAADILAGMLGFYLTRRLVRSMPKDDAAPPIKPSWLSDLLPFQMQTIASAQSDIDNKTNIR